MQRSKATPQRSNSRRSAASTGGPAGLATLPAGGVIAGRATEIPAGLFSRGLGLDADVSGELAGLAPTFGDVLLSVGTGVAKSQEALDKSLVDTAKQLSNTKIKVVTDVIQKLDDDGIPVAAQTQLVTNDVALINYVNPTVHEWKNVALSMDLTVGALDSEAGISFHQHQFSTEWHAYGLFWGFLGWFDTDETTKDTTSYQHWRQESNWATGQVRLDALLGPRRTSKFPVPADVSIGPQIVFTQGSVSERREDGKVVARSIDVIISVRKASGAVNPGVPLEVDVSAFRFSFSSTGGFDGSTTNADGKVKLTITRDIPSETFLRSARAQVRVKLGQITKSIEISL